MRRSETAVAGGLATKEAAQDWIDALAATRPDAPADCGCAYEVTPGGVYPERRYFHEPDCAAEPPEPSA